MHCGSGSPSTVRLRSFFGRYGAEEPIHLAVDPVSEIEGIRTPIASSDSERECPQASRMIVASVDGNALSGNDNAPVKKNKTRWWELLDIRTERVTGSAASSG